MSDKRMLILPAELVKKVDDNRGDLSQAEFVDFLIESQLKDGESKTAGADNKALEGLRQELKDLLLREKKLATKDELQAFREDTRKLLKSFVDFFVGYGLELGEKSPAIDLKDITGKLKGLETDLPPAEEGREVKIKWK